MTELTIAQLREDAKYYRQLVADSRKSTGISGWSDSAAEVWREAIARSERAAAMAEALIAERQRTNLIDWRLPLAAMPENGSTVLVTLDEYPMFLRVTAVYFEGGRWWRGSGTLEDRPVLAWSPLPPPYNPAIAHQEAQEKK